MGTTDTEQPDLTLLRAYLNGSQDAFTTLMQRHVDFVYSAAVRQVRDRHLAEDVVQAVFLVLAQKAKSLKADTVLVAWLHRTTRYCAANAMRVASHRRFHENRMRHMAPRDEREDEVVDWGRLSEVLDRAINKLPTKQRQAILLRYFSQKTHAQVGQEIGLSTAAATKQIQRGLERLRHTIDRAGLALSVPVLAHALQSHVIQPAPAQLVATLKAGSLAATAGSSAISTSIAKGAIQMIRWSQIKLTALVAAGTALVAGGVATAVVATNPTTASSLSTSVQLRWVSSGATKRIGYCVPIQTELSPQKPATIRKLPADLSNALYGALRTAGPAGAVYHIAVDEPAGKPRRLFVDANGDGDLTNDPLVEWKATPTEFTDNGQKTNVHSAEGKQCFTCQGTGTLNLGTAGAPRLAAFEFYRFDAADPHHANRTRTIFCYPTYYLTGQVTLGEKTYPVSLFDMNATGDFRSGHDPQNGGGGVKMLIDLDGRGKPDSQYNIFDTDAPFNVGGTTYELRDIAKDGSSFSVAKGTKHVAERTAKLRGTLKQALAFKATNIDGAKVNFPDDYKGKIVLLDFWATWCGPCMEEVPGLVAAYGQFHEKGFEVLGVSLDEPNETEKVKSVMNEHKMTWPQIYDGGGVKSEVVQLYHVQAIPAPFLIDGDTGKVLATSDQLRGANLIPTIRDALAKKAAAAK
jgi:RNA polymerase sigma factor (sigma-70 family)